MNLSQVVINRQIAALFLDLDKHVAWNDRMVLNQVVVRRTEAGWQLIIKASGTRTDMVSYLSTDTFSEALDLAGEFADNGALKWVADKYPAKYKERPHPKLG